MHMYEIKLLYLFENIALFAYNTGEYVAFKLICIDGREEFLIS